MSTNTTTARAEHEEDLPALAARWPQFSVRELSRLRFQLHRRRTGRIRPPAAVRADTEALCAALLGGTSPPAPAAPQLQPPVRAAPRPQPPIPMGVPPLWAAWAAQQRARQQRSAT
jgi:hypothetical protein